MTDSTTAPEFVPDVTEVTGVYVDSDGVVHLRYLSADRKTYVIRFPIDQILRAEDWFIRIRNGARFMADKKAHR
jgi:hypothetical protein